MAEKPKANLVDIHGPALNGAIEAIASEFPSGIVKRPQPPDDALFVREVIKTQGLNCDASAACSVLNAIACLGLVPNQKPETLLAELAELHLRPEMFGPQLMKEKDGLYIPNDLGIVHLFTMAGRAENKQPLPITVTRVNNMGLAHDYLAHGYTALVVDEPTSQALAVGGMEQVNGKVNWFVIPAGSHMEEVASGLRDRILPFLGQYVNAYAVNPQKLISRVSTPLWVVSRQQ
jgi:hypothetical protein